MNSQTTDQITHIPGSTEVQELRIMQAVSAELAAARHRYPAWPTDIVLATVVMVEEATEALKAANEIRWQHKETTVVAARREIIQTMAMCLRLLTETPGLKVGA